ncbi:MAG: hypothetical protein RL338_1180 [Chloroflexota bacterium]
MTIALAARPLAARGVAARPRAAATGPSTATRAATAFVARMRDDARALGRELADAVQDPAGLAAAAAAGMRRLGDPVYREAQAWVVPGSRAVAGVRVPLQRAVWGAFRRRTRTVRPSTLLLAADALLRDGTTELRLFAIELLTRTLPTDPERSWQLLRRTAREAGEWVTVDALARACATGIIRERYRWAELEQLVYSPSRWERRLVGSTIATIPFVDREAGRRPEVATRGLALVGELIGDADADVQRALGWALRNLVLVDPAAVLAFCRAEASTAAATGDGNRARVIRSALPKLPSGEAAEIGQALAGLRRTPAGAPTSRAASIAAAFAVTRDPAAHPEPPLR